MKRTTRKPGSSLPLRPVEFHILLVLAEGERHGYGIIRDTEIQTEGQMRLETGTLYRALRRLSALGLVRPTKRRPASDLDDERRRYFAITPMGRRVAAAEARRMAKLVEVARDRDLIPGAKVAGAG
jgi:DNA-binding PadR family transcriptional regulator